MTVNFTTSSAEPLSASRLSRVKLPLLYSFTAFLGASLLFIVEPLSTKLLLPSFGGAATLWATATLFFQVVLLVGYLLIHYSSALTPKRQGLLLGVLALTAVVSLPIAFGGNTFSGTPVVRVLLALSVLVGLPFLLVATTGPLTQRWYSLTNGPRSQDPYFIYAASNIGSFVGLLSYPLVIEPFLPLKAQGWLWTGLFATFVVFLVACYLTVAKSDKASKPAALFNSEISWGRRLKWVFLAFVPSSLFLGVTTHLATDVGSFPLLWVIPLAIYLLTMILAFARKSRRVPKPLTVITVLVAVGAAYLLGTQKMVATDNALVLLVTTSLVTLFAVGFLFHATLAADRPAAEHLTGFFVVVSFGGALGGLFNGFIAPFIFKTPIEVFIVLLLPIALLFSLKVHDLALVSVLTIVGCLTLMTASNVTALTKERTFYGTYRVETNGEENALVSGTTIHGRQELARPLEPTAYYSKGGPIGSLFSVGSFKRVAAVGLGTGTIATYGKPGDEYHFIEIDPAVEKLAMNPKYFTFLRDSRANVKVTIGDGRLELANVPDGSLDLLILDAFSSDSIPTHLLTKEAFEGYRKKLTPNGAIAIHTSNRFYDLSPVISAAARQLQTPLLFSDQRAGNAFRSHWWVLTKDENLQKKLLADEWSAVEVTPVEWTDDYAPLLELLYALK